MGMVVRSNITALNANRQLGMNNSQVGKSLEKLSSGFKINRAGDDASGLAISEKMKAQIKGLETASSNSQDGVSLIQTAEGALTEVHSMLNRMTELATKSANGTFKDEVDREAIQEEVNALATEINRIGDSTNFNGINLLDGSLGGYRVDTMDVTDAAGVDASTIRVNGDLAGALIIFGADANGNLEIAEIETDDMFYELGSSVAGDDTVEEFLGSFVKTSVNSNGDYHNVTLTVDWDSMKRSEQYLELDDEQKNKYIKDFEKLDGVSISYKGTAPNTNPGDANSNPMVDGSEIVVGDASAGLNLQIGDTGDSFNQVAVAVGDMRANNLGVGNLNVGAAEAAKDSIQTIKDAINLVSTNRANLGALQNRVEHTINNLDVSAENLNSANSRIRDTDMAKQMMEYTKMNVLTQSAQAMLAQANQQPQSILQLLQ